MNDIGNTPTSLRIRNEGNIAGIIVQVSDDRSTWLTLLQKRVAAWAVPNSVLASVRFARVYTDHKCRLFGSAINLQ